MESAKTMDTQVPLKSAFLYTQPSLPHLLTEYGLPDKQSKISKKDKDAEPTKGEKQATKKKKKKKSDSFYDHDDERELQRQKEKEEHYEQLMKDMYRLRDYYYHHYTSLLAEKTQRQRRERRQRDQLMREQNEKKEEEERKASHTVKKRLQHHDLETIPAHQQMPKTDLYYIVGLEDKLRREGKLKTNADYDKFRNEIQQPHIFYSNFKVNKHSDFTKYPSSSGDRLSSISIGESHDTFSMSDGGQWQLHPQLQLHHQQRQQQQQQQQQQQLRQPQEAQQQRSLSRISEAQESSRPSTRMDSTRVENWAVTQQYQAHHKPRKSLGAQSGKAKADTMSDLERRFPKLEMPKLHCFTMNLAKKPPDPEEVQRNADLKAKERHRKTLARTITKMYQLAMSNAAASTRILDQHEDIDMMFNGPDLCDVIADHHWMEVYGLSDLDVPATTPPQEHVMDDRALQRVEDQRGDEEEEEEMTSGGSMKEITLPDIEERQKSAGSVKHRSSSAKSKGSAAEDKTSPPQPLTLGEIKEKCSVVEAKTLSTLWTNYLRAGK